MAGEHSSFSPSSAERVILCPASYKANLGRPSTTSWFAVEGTIAHYIHAYLMNNDAVQDDFIGKHPSQFMHVDEMHPEEWAVVPPSFVVDQEMLDYVLKSMDWCYSLMPVMELDATYIESRVSIARYTPESKTKQSGTCDVGLIYRDGTLVIVDLKYGKGVKVDADNNPQLALYALGFMEAYDDLYAFERVLIAVSQPRLNHFDVWETDATQLRSFGDSIKASFELALTDDAPYNPTEKGCKFCAFKAECPALYQTALDMFDYISTVGGNVPAGTTGEHVADILAKRSLIRDYIDAIEERAEHMLLHDEVVPGYKLVEGRSSRVWGCPEDYTPVMLESMGVDPYTEPKLISVAEAEKRLPKGIKKDVLKEFVTKNPGKPTVALESDPRSRWTNTSIDMFDII